MKFYLDENVPASVQAVLQERGHTVVWTRDILPLGSPDDMVAAVSEEAEATLISHDKDFKRIAPRIPNGERTRFKKLSMIRLMCEKPRSAQRITTVLPFIELDNEQREIFPDIRSIIEIKKDLIAIWR